MPRHISAAQRAQIVILKEQNFNFSHIARILNLKNPSTVRSIWLNYQKTKSLESKKPTGRPKKLTERDERVIMRKLKKDSFVTARQVQTEFNAWSCHKTVCEKTIRRLFKKKGLHGRSAAKKILLNAKTRVARLAWCRQKSIYRLTTGQVSFSPTSADSNFGVMDGCGYGERKVSDTVQKRLSLCPMIGVQLTYGEQ